MPLPNENRATPLDEWKKQELEGHGAGNVQMLQKSFAVQIQDQAEPEDGEDLILRFASSTGSPDRHKDTLDPNGWQLENYRKNPVVLWAHSYKDPPVGKNEPIYVADGLLVSETKFTPRDVNPFGYMVYCLYKEGFLHAKSVGFRPLEWVYNEDRGGFDFKVNELLEDSCVPVPANPDALLLAGRKGIELAPLREWAEKTLDEMDGLSSCKRLWVPRETIEAAWKAAKQEMGQTIYSLSFAVPDELAPRIEESLKQCGAEFGQAPLPKQSEPANSVEDAPEALPEELKSESYGPLWEKEHGGAVSRWLKSVAPDVDPADVTEVRVFFTPDGAPQKAEVERLARNEDGNTYTDPCTKAAARQALLILGVDTSPERYASPGDVETLTPAKSAHSDGEIPAIELPPPKETTTQPDGQAIKGLLPGDELDSTALKEAVGNEVRRHLTALTGRIYE